MIMYRLRMTFLTNKSLLLLSFGLEERLFVPLFVSSRIPLPTTANTGESRQIWAESAY